MSNTYIIITSKYTKKRVKASTDNRFPDEKDYGKLSGAVLLHIYAGSPHKSPGFGAHLWFPPVARLPSMYVCAARVWSAQFNFWCACQQYNGDREVWMSSSDPMDQPSLKGGWVGLNYSTHCTPTVICVIQAVFGFAPCIPTCVGGSDSFPDCW